LSQVSPLDRDVKVQIRFTIEPFEIGIETASKESETGTTIASLISAVQARQGEISEAISSIDVSKFKPIRQKLVMEAENPLEKTAMKLNVEVEKLKKIFIVEKDEVFIVCPRDKFGERGAGEKAVLTMLYVYKYGLDKSPRYEEVNEAYKKLGFRPRSFGKTAKGSLLRLGKISEDRKSGTIAIEPRAIPEAEVIIRELLPKL